VQFTVDTDDGATIDFACADTFTSRWVCNEILAGKTYPYLPFVDDVRVVFDVGANVGAASVHFARHYPTATVHAFEPGSEAWGYLAGNVAAWPNVEAHRFGLHRADQTVPFYKGDGDSILGSVFRRSVNTDDTETVELRAAGPWAAANGIDRIDLLKVDVEGCEIDVLDSLGPLLAGVKVLYVEYDSRQARRDIARLVDDTHELYRGMVFLDQGECVYLRKDLADHPDANAELLRQFTQGRSASG
jgi:FkbM family methyltransferase